MSLTRTSVSVSLSKVYAFGNQTLLEDAVIFNDAVVHDAHPRGGMRVAVHVAGLTVGSPPGVPNAAEALCQSLCGQFLAQLCQRPLLFTTRMPPSRASATPAESYPRYSSFPDRPAAHPVRCACRHNQQCHTYKTPPCRRPPRRKNAQPGPSASLSVYVLVWLSLKGSVAVSLPFFALLCGWSSFNRRNIRRNFR